MRTVLWVSLVVSSVLGGTGPTAGQSPLVAAVLVPTPASAQEGALAGRVLDAAGDPLPGVTVEVLGSAPGETRLEVTDREGRYRIDDLLPGAYAVWFTLPGFQWVVGDRDVDVGVVDVGAGRVTTADAEMAITWSPNQRLPQLPKTWWLRTSTSVEPRPISVAPAARLQRRLAARQTRQR